MKNNVFQKNKPAVFEEKYGGYATQKSVEEKCGPAYSKSVCRCLSPLLGRGSGWSSSKEM